MKKTKFISIFLAVILLISFTALLSSAAEEDTATITSVTENEQTQENENSVKSSKAIAAAVTVGLAAAAGAIAMAIAVKQSVDGIARQPESAGNIRTSMMMGLVFIETAIIYALIVAILIIFVL
ncbi:MAG: ATP synthase F0 subunit C [Clostridia bacterium]|nr:ATP synthase F0 subunit C [Clostridia bacterium]